MLENKTDISMLVSQFYEKGYLVISNALRRESVKNFCSTLEVVVDSIVTKANLKNKIDLRSLDINSKIIALSQLDFSYLSIAQRILSRTPEFYQLCAETNLFNAIRAIFGLNQLDPIYVLSNGIVFNMPNCSETRTSANLQLDWHKDDFFTIPNSPFVQFWGPVLNSSTEKSGTLQVCVKSHKKPTIKQVFHPESTFNYRYTVPSEEVLEFEKKSINLEPGELVIFDGNLVHASGFNTDKNPRVSILGVCHNAKHENCIPVSTVYKYHGKTPEMLYYEKYHDEAIKKVMYESLSPETPEGGV